MGVYNAAVITNNGLSLIAQAAAGQGQIVFTSAQTSSYAYPESTDFASLTSLQDVVQTQTSVSAQVFNDTLVQATVRFDNSSVSEAYLIQTIGLFAQLGDSGSPVLFSVVTATTPDQMPAQSAVSPSAFVYVIQSTVQQASSIVVTTNPAGTATLQDLVNQLYDGFNYSMPGKKSLDASVINTATSLTTGDFFALEKGNYIAIAGLTNAPNSTDAFFLQVTTNKNQKILQAISLTTGRESVNYYNGSSWLSEWKSMEIAGGITSIPISVSDFNLITSSGHYYVQTVYNTQNSPPNTNNGYLDVYSANSNSVTQIFKPWTDMVFYARQQENGVWSDWDSVVMGSQIQSGVVSITSIPGDTASVHVKFDKTFLSIPNVLVTLQSSTARGMSVTVSNVLSNGFDVFLYTESNVSVAARNVYWQATTA